jgi:hypothetical protein
MHDGFSMPLKYHNILILLIGGPGVVAPHCIFNNLDCQTAVTVIAGAESKLRRCKIGIGNDHPDL